MSWNLHGLSKELSQRLTGGTEDKHEDYQSVRSVFQPGFERTSSQYMSKHLLPRQGRHFPQDNSFIGNRRKKIS
jgi:hypothetical protein